MSKVKGEYSTWMAEMGWTACALRRVEAEISESPRYLTFPALEKMSIPLANGGRGGHSLDQLGHLGDGVFNRDRRVGAVEVVEVDALDPQPRQRLVEGLMDILWVGLHEPIGLSMAETKLRGKGDLVALSGLLEPM